MSLTDEQCEKLCGAILNVYPYENKVALESFFNDKFDIKLEFTNSYSDIISANDLSIDIPKNNKKLKILVLQANTRNLNLNQEFYLIESAIEKSSNRSLFDKPIFKPVYSTDDIRRAIANENPQIVHFCGHALEDGSLKLENDSNESFVSPETLKSFFEGREDIIKCVLLNACDSAEAAIAISHHVDYTIGMNDKIIDEVAIEFAKGFYDGLGSETNNKDIFLRAFNEGVRAIIAKDSSQKLIPIVKKRINSRDVILRSVKNINKKELIYNLKSDPNLYKDKLFINFYTEYSYPINQDDLYELSKIIREIEYENLVKAYRKTLPENAMVDNSELNYPENINNIIDILRKDFPEIGSNKVPSILVFAINLAEKFEKKSQEHQRIKSWIEKISSKLSIPISVKAKDEFSSREFYTYLLIIVNDEGNKFNLRAEYILEDENLTIIQQNSLNLPGQKEQTGITCDSFNEISHQVKKYYDELFHQQLSNSQLKNIQIELFLPIQYLIKNIDKEWFIDDDISGLTQIVREHNIVLRPSERLKKPEFYVKLKNNFKRFNESLKGYIDEDIFNKEIEIVNQKIVDSNFQKISDNFKDKKICVKLIYNGIPEIAFFRAIIRGSICIAFWRRCSIPEDSNFSDIDNDLNLEFFQNNFRNLVEKMYELRRDASHDENNDEKSYPLGFLCDNPNRIPNINPFKSL